MASMASDAKARRGIVFTAQDREKFAQALNKIIREGAPMDMLLNCLGAHRQGETAALAREELKRILERREEFDDILNLDSGALWSLDEEKLFEYGLQYYDGSTPDRFGQIAASIMCNVKSRDDCRRRYQKLILDVCQIELGSKSVSVFYFTPQYHPSMSAVGGSQWLS